MAKPKRFLSTLLASILLLLHLPAMTEAAYFDQRNDFHPPATIPKWVKPLTKPLPHVAQGVIASEVTLLLSRYMPQLVSLLRQLAPTLIQRLPMLPRLARTMPATCAIVLANALVFSLWRLALASESRALVTSMQSNFILSSDARETQKRPYTILTSGFSHKDAQHIGSNMMALLTFGSQPEKWLGARKYMYMYIASIYGSKWINSLAFQKLIGQNNNGPSGSLGASGAISALQAYFCLRFPSTQFRVQGKPLPAPWACVVWYGTELMQLRRENQTGIGHGAHLGGYTFGALFFLLHDYLLATKHQRKKALRQILDVVN